MNQEILCLVFENVEKRFEEVDEKLCSPGIASIWSSIQS